MTTTTARVMRTPEIEPLTVAEADRMPNVVALIARAAEQLVVDPEVDERLGQRAAERLERGEFIPADRERGTVELADDAEVVEVACEALPLRLGRRHQMGRAAGDRRYGLRLALIQWSLSRVAVCQLDGRGDRLAAAHQDGST